MYHRELEIPFQQNISDKFFDVVSELHKTQEPGRIFDLTREPTKDELKFLVSNYGNEVGLVRLNLSGKQHWKLIEGDYHHVAIPKEIDELSDISVHSHPTEINDLTLPSLGDLLHCNLNGKKFIFNINELMYYSEIEKHPITGLAWKPQDVNELRRLYKYYFEVEAGDHKININHYRLEEKFLNTMEVKITRKPWKHLPNNPFSGFKI
jgi:hypothetical protein